MERSRIPLIYGYAVCLVSVVTFLIVVPNLIDNAFRLARPLQPNNVMSGERTPALSSFEAYKATSNQGRMSGAEGAQAAPPEEELRRQYEALREDRISNNRFAAIRGLVSLSLLGALALGMFVGHWRWLKRQGKETAVA